MEGFIDDLTGGNTTEVKVVLACVIAALAIYQLGLIAIAYGKLRPSFAHRAVGDALVVLIVVVAVMCISYFEIEDEATLHVIAAIGLLAVLAFKVAVIRWWHGLSRLLPLLGISVWALIAVTVATSAGDFLTD
jgi:hypothetical protein